MKIQRNLIGRRLAELCVLSLCALPLFGIAHISYAQEKADATQTAPSQVNDPAVMARLNQFTQQLKTFSADFVQTLYGADASVLQTNNGTVVLKRPGKFIWRYTEDDAQEIIADGTNIWLFDKELEQVSVSALEERVGGTPLVLLMGGSTLEDQFTITTVGSSDGIDWIELIPIDNSADFEKLYIGLTDTNLTAMELRDNFGQATQIQFSKFVADIALEDDLFNFIPPDGVDVIGNVVQ